MDAPAIVVALLALALGLAAGWIWARTRAAAEAAASAAAARAELERATAALQAAIRERDTEAAEHRAWRASAEEHRKSEEQARRELEAAFAQLSQAALKLNSEQFLVLAREKDAASGKALADLLTPFREKLDKLEAETKALESARQLAYGSLGQQLTSLAQATESLNSNSRALSTALRGDARARGRWGEVALRNIVEFAGMTPHCDFTEQETTDEGRPDMIVVMPGGDGRIPVDSKVPMDAYLRGIDAEDPALRKQEFAKHADDLRNHMRSLARRDYSASLGARVDYTIMFIPAEPVLAAAFEADPTLQQDAMEKRVLLATPVTLLALLRTVALYWSQTRVADEAAAVWEAAREFNARVKTFAVHLERVGKGLRSALDHYDNAVGSYERMLLPQGRRLEELGAAATGEPLPELEPIGRAPRALEAPATPAPDERVESA
ncbi:MAG TPA: DNA recombination protein RmuC [Planctomycetota bacterium]|nr:DNA recombination protein RmuC [Planctomycetota bacterium]